MKTPLHILDDCTSCGGECCKYISIPVSDINTSDTQWLLARGELTGNVWRIPSRCKHLTDNGRCSIYASRPQSCRDFEVGGPSCRRAQAKKTNNTHKKETR